METATIIARRMGMPMPLPVQSLVERHYGEAEGCTREDLDARYPGDTPVPGREPREDVQQRVVRTLNDLAIRHPHADIVVVSHGGVIRSVVEYTSPGVHVEPIKNCSVHSFEHSAHGLRLVAFDDPMEVMARRIGEEEFAEQNPAEAREKAS
jgi:probable phosphoglycerate mutase